MPTHKPNRPTHIPAFVTPYNKLLVRTIAGRCVYALLRHRGRKSGKSYVTPVMAWHTKGGMLIPLAWGPASDWYRNLIAAKNCDVQINGRWYHCADPVLIQRDQALSLLSLAARMVVRLSPVPVQRFVLLRQVDALV